MTEKKDPEGRKNSRSGQPALVVWGFDPALRMEFRHHCERKGTTMCPELSKIVRKYLDHAKKRRTGSGKAVAAATSDFQA